MKEAKVYKLFPAPHIEVRVAVSEEMLKDIRNCHEYEEDCTKCSWWDVRFGCEGMCDYLKERIQKEE